MKRHLHISRIALQVTFVFSLLFGWKASAQTYPVQAHIVTTSPYLNYLSYYGDQNNHLQITLTNLDFNSPSMLVRLRLRIEGTGWELYTNPNATIGQPFLLDPGMPLTISGIELLPYLLQNNLVNPNGIDINNLPEDFATICVDVIRESANQEVLSTNNCALLPIQLVRPPTPYLPDCGTRLDTTTMFELFQWFAPNPPAVGMGVETKYDLSIYYWQDTTNFSDNAWLFNPIYQQTDIAWVELFNVELFDLLLVPGGKYVWNVKARVFVDNVEKTNATLNNGLSQNCVFYYGEAPTLADQLADGLEIVLTAEQLAERKGIASWTVNDNTPNQGLSHFDEYVLEYRKQPTGNEGFEIPWFSKTLTDTSDFIYQLEPSTTYEVKVSGVIAGVVGDPTPVVTFTTPDPRVYNCGEADLPYLPNTFTPLENATVGTQVQIGQFTMSITELNEFGGGHYAGKGEIPVAFLGGAKAKVRFTDILIDTEYRVHEGRVDVITEGLDNWLNEQYQQFIDPYYVNGVIDSAWVDTVAGVAWVTVDGVDQQFTFDPPTYPIIVNDENGNQYTIYPNGTIIVSNYLAISETWAVNSDEVVYFTQNVTELRGFDAKEHMQWHENYEIMMLADSSKYFVANKSLAKDEGDYVNVEIPSGVNASFEFSDGTPINALPLQSDWLGETKHIGSTKMTLSIPARSSTGNYSIYAFANNQKVGQLNVVVYSKKERELVVVPIASTNLTAAQIKAELDNTLGEANLDIDVEITPQWTDTTGTFTASTNVSLPAEVGLLNKYSDDMREIRDLYFEQNPNADKSKYYIFVVNGFDEPNELGYMVRGRALGFVKASQQDVLHTISHELGHGMGALEHSWKSNGPGEGTTSNLMDYASPSTSSGGATNNLIKAQWKELRDLDVVPSLFDEVEDAALSGDIVYYYKVKINSSGQVMSREYWKRENYVRLYKDSDLDGNWDSTPYLYDGTISKVTTVNYVFNESGKLVNSYRYKNVVYYNYTWSNGDWVRTFDTDSDHITLSNYDFPVSHAYTVKKYYRNNELVSEKVYDWNGNRMDVDKLASSVSPPLSIHARGAEFLADHLESGMLSYMPGGTVIKTSIQKVEGGYDVIALTFELGVMVTDVNFQTALTIHIPNTATRYEMQDMFREYGLVQNNSYEYSLFIQNVPDTWSRYANWSESAYDGAQGGSPPFVVALFSDILMGIPGAVHGYWTGQHWRTGEELTGWDHVWNSLEMIPVAGIFGKTFKNSVKGLKVYNKATGTFFDVVAAAKKLPTSLASKLSYLKTKGLRIAAEAENELYIIINETGEKLARISDNIIEILKPYTGTLNQPQWSLALGDMQVKIGDDIVEQSIEIRKYGDEVNISRKAVPIWEPVQSISNKYPDEALPLDGQLWGIAEIDNGLISSIGNKSITQNSIDFVVSKNGELKLGKKHHFLGNKDHVEAAGTLKIVNGKIKRITNDSGHYTPTIDQTDKFPKIFRQLGLDTKGASLQILYVDESGVTKEITKFLSE